MQSGIMAMLRGLIVLWYGAEADIPAGFVLCNGANGTPDLRNRFVIGAGTTYAPDATGGGVNHTHDFTGDGHVHARGGLAAPAFEGIPTDPMLSTAVTGTTDYDGILPPYYSLCYIMKL